MTALMTTPAGDRLTDAERGELARREAAVKAGFTAAAENLAYIRDHRLYREGFATFEAYLSARWNIGRAQGYRLVEHATTLRALAAPCGPPLPLPTAERQTRPLKKLPLPVRREAYAAAVEMAGGKTPSGPLVDAAVKMFVPKVVGGTDAPGPGSLADRHRPRTLDDVIGQDGAVARLRAFAAAPYPHAFLFDGPTGTGKTSAGLALAAALGAVEFGGLEVIRSGTANADAIGRALHALNFTPMLGSGWKLVIVDEADAMTHKAAVAWLSALEGIPPRSVIVFTTNDAGRFHPRFLDRCERLTFAGDAERHAGDAQALIARVWRAETGRADAPRLADLPGVIDREGVLSYRRALRALEPIVTAARGRPAETEPAPATQRAERMRRRATHHGTPWRCRPTSQA